MKKRLLATALLSITLLGAVSTQSVKADDTVNVTATATESEYLGDALYVSSSGTPAYENVVGYIDANGQLYDTSGNLAQDYELQPYWLIATAYVTRHPNYAVDSQYQIVDKTTGEIKGKLTDFTRYEIKNNWITDRIRNVSTSLDKLAKYGTVHEAWKQAADTDVSPVLTLVDSAERETDSSLGEIDLFESEGINTFETYSANFKTKADLDAFITVAEEKLKDLGLSPGKYSQPYYSTESIANLMTSLGYDEKLYRIENDKSSYRFVLGTRVVYSVKGAYTVPHNGLFVNIVKENELATNRTAYVTLVKEIMDMANKAAAASWGVNTGTTAAQSSSRPMYRLYNRTTNQHFYTSNPKEVSLLQSRGWRNEGTAWKVSSEKTGSPVYRMWNIKTGERIFTRNKSEADKLVTRGWKNEGIAFYTQSRGQSIYRLRNKHTGKYLLTVGQAEVIKLVSSGQWQNEGTAFYGVQ